MAGHRERVDVHQKVSCVERRSKTDSFSGARQWGVGVNLCQVEASEQTETDVNEREGGETCVEF